MSSNITVIRKGKYRVDGKWKYKKVSLKGIREVEKQLSKYYFHIRTFGYASLKIIHDAVHSHSR